MKLETLTLNGTTYDSFPDKDAVKTVNGKNPDANGNVAISASDVGALPSTYTPPDQTAEQVGADPKGTAASAVSQHNTSDDSHNDIRLELKAINDRLTAFFDSDNQTLDELSEIVAYITSNKTLIEAITDSKVSVLDIVNNLTTNVANKPLSAAQGVALKALIDAITIPTKLSQLTNDKGFITGYTETDPTVPAWAKAESKPGYSKSEVGLGNVDDVKQYSAINPPVVVQSSAPSDTSVIWVDPDDEHMDEFTDAVLYSEQSTTPEQQAQAQKNIGIVKEVGKTSISNNLCDGVYEWGALNSDGSEGTLTPETYGFRTANFLPVEGGRKVLWNADNTTTGNQTQFQYKNQLILEQANKKTQLENEYYARYQDVLKQINTENALAEEVRQYNEKMAEEKRQYDESMAEEKRQYNESLALQKAQLEEEKRQYNETMAYNKSKSSGSGGSGGGGNSGGGGSLVVGPNGDDGKPDDTPKKGIKTYESDMASLQALGLGNATAADLARLMDQGIIKRTLVNGKWYYTRGNNNRLQNMALSR